LFDVVPPQRRQLWWAESHSTLRYLMQTEAHVYALAIAASTLLSFYPFVTVMLSFCRNVLRWRAGEAAIYLALKVTLPGDLGVFLRNNPPPSGSFEVLSMFLLLLTANGVFEPLEVALNRALGVVENRSYIRNQLISLGLIFVCGGLALLSFMFTAFGQGWNGGFRAQSAVPWWNLVLFKLGALAISVLALFLVYWLLPNCKVRARTVLPVAVLVGAALEAIKYIDLFLFPLMQAKLVKEYGVFQHSALILLWSFLGSLIVLAGAHWSARRGAKGQEPIVGSRAKSSLPVTASPDVPHRKH
jgi:uncharacterized BrkB/YihY/UPF0761 family membrane protein